MCPIQVVGNLESTVPWLQVDDESSTVYTNNKVDTLPGYGPKLHGNDSSSSGIIFPQKEVMIEDTP